MAVGRGQADQETLRVRLPGREFPGDQLFTGRPDEHEVAADQLARRLLGLFRVGTRSHGEPFRDSLGERAGEQGGERAGRPRLTGDRGCPYPLAGAEAAVGGDRGTGDQQPATGELGVIEAPEPSATVAVAAPRARAGPPGLTSATENQRPSSEMRWVTTPP